MPTTTCKTCGGPHSWNWEEAFDKFGFNDGDGDVHTFTVATILEEAGYDVACMTWGLHNTIIDSIKRDGVELIPANARVGFADPRDYLPKPIIEILDAKLASDLPYQGL